MTANLNHQRRSADRDSEDSIANLVLQGAVHAVRKWIKSNSSSMSIPVELFSNIEQGAVNKANQLKSTLGLDIRNTLAETGMDIEFSCRPPIVSIGCVRFQELETGLWDLTLFEDDHAVRKVHTSSGSTLVLEALSEISALQKNLKSEQRLLSNLRKAIEYLARFCDQIPVNPLMLLAGQDGSLRNSLESYQPKANSKGMSRAVLGFLLRRLCGESGAEGYFEDFKVRLVGATQVHTCRSDDHVPVPEAYDPARTCLSKPVHAIKICD